MYELLIYFSGMFMVLVVAILNNKLSEDKIPLSTAAMASLLSWFTPLLAAIIITTAVIIWLLFEVVPKNRYYIKASIWFKQND